MKISNFKFQILKREYIILLGILALALFMRAYRLDAFMIFDHDQDLYSWIVKDIAVEHHLRLIGQLTSIEGVFVGPLFYYLLVPFFVLFGMNPLAANGLTLMISLGTGLSIYFIFTRFFGKTAGLFGTFIYAVSLGLEEFDRWVVPTQPTVIWTVWYIYCLFSLAKGEHKYALPVTAILLGLIWHVHIALLPLIFPLILAYLLSPKKKVPLKLITMSTVIFFVLTAPFWVFELKHSFIQTKALLFSHNTGVDVPLGAKRVYKILESVQAVMKNVVFLDWYIPVWVSGAFVLIVFLVSAFKRFFTFKQLILVLSWIGSVFAVIMLTKNQISEYYVSNFMILAVLILAVFFARLSKIKFLFWPVIALILAYGLINLNIFIQTPDPWNKYKYRLQAAEFISRDVKARNYPCMVLSFIADPGKDRGFTYLLWWEGVKMVRAQSGAPVYTVVIPYDLIPKERLSTQFHYFGVIAPKDPPPIDPKVCSDPKYEPIPLLGFTN